MRPEIYVDLDETLIHSLSVVQVLGNRLDLIFPGEASAHSRRQALDTSVKAKMPNLESSDFSLKFHIRKELELRIVTEKLEQTGWIHLHPLMPEKDDSANTKSMFFKPRPSANRFLHDLSEMADLFICSTSQSDYATAILKHMGWAHYFKQIFCREQISSAPLCGLSDERFLIDNNSYFEPDSWIKLRFLGFDVESHSHCFVMPTKHQEIPPVITRTAKHYIQISPFDGTDSSDSSGFNLNAEQIQIHIRNSLESI